MIDPNDWWEERAAIMEFDGGLSRAEAEDEALGRLLEVLEREANEEDQEIG